MKSELTKRFEAIRRHYASLPIDMNRGDLFPNGDPYAWDRSHTGIKLTPIEWAVWQEMRAEDIVMVPQYPVGRFFVDFANPAEKVAVECDGAAWHMDEAKDMHRQVEIEAMGWTVYRISGRDCLSQRNSGNGFNPARALAKVIGDRFDIHHCCRGAVGDGRIVHVSELMVELLDDLIAKVERREAATAQEQGR
jgi:hypothetical protein